MNPETPAAPAAPPLTDLHFLYFSVLWSGVAAAVKETPDEAGALAWILGAAILLFLLFVIGTWRAREMTAQEQGGNPAAGAPRRATLLALFGAVALLLMFLRGPATGGWLVLLFVVPWYARKLASARTRARYARAPAWLVALALQGGVTLVAELAVQQRASAARRTLEPVVAALQEQHAQQRSWPAKLETTPLSPELAAALAAGALVWEPPTATRDGARLALRFWHHACGSLASYVESASLESAPAGATSPAPTGASSIVRWNLCSEGPFGRNHPASR